MKRSRNVVKRSMMSVAMGTRALEPGDTYEVEVEGVGVLSNPVVQGR